MYYRVLGNTGLVSSIYGFGFWATFGVKNSLLDREGINQAKAILSIARQGGINLFDNAETYGNPVGEAERIFGQALKELQQEENKAAEQTREGEEAPKLLWKRSEIIVTTKLFWGGSGYNERGLSRKHIQEGMNASLKRLQLDYVDIIYCHRPDSLTSTDNIVRSMTELVRSGKAMCWGTSEWSAQQITEAYWIARSEGLEPPQIEQPQYHMMERDRVELEYYPLYRQPYNLATTIWSPLASGLLTGKYNSGTVPEGSRATQKGYEWLNNVIEQWKASGKLDKVSKLQEYMKSQEALKDHSLAELALAWCVKSNPNVSCVLLGATKVSQIESNLRSLEVLDKLTEEHLKAIEEILDNKPKDFWGHGNRKIPTV